MAEKECSASEAQECSWCCTQETCRRLLCATGWACAVVPLDKHRVHMPANRNGLSPCASTLLMTINVAIQIFGPDRHHDGGHGGAS